MTQALLWSRWALTSRKYFILLSIGLGWYDESLADYGELVRSTKPF